MKRYFLFIFLIYIGLNTVYKSYIYFQSDKVLGKVVRFERYSKTRTTRSGKTVSISISPVIAYTYKNFDWEASQDRWGHMSSLNEGDEVTVLIEEKKDKVHLHTFFQFWFTLHDMFIVFSLCFVGTLILEGLFPTKERVPKTWK